MTFCTFEDAPMTAEEFVDQERRKLTVFARFMRQVRPGEEHPTAAWWREAFRKHQEKAERPEERAHE